MPGSAMLAIALFAATTPSFALVNEAAALRKAAQPQVLYQRQSWEALDSNANQDLRLRGAAAGDLALASVLKGDGSSNPDDEVRHRFVQKCTVALSVKDASLLPMDAFTKFCKGTGAPVECRQLFKGLGSAHKEGTIGAFCVYAYEWFQKKYGDYCPTQCEKLQCRSTCKWLAKRKSLQTEYDALVKQKENDRVAARADKRAIKETEGRYDQAMRTVNSSKVAVTRLEAKLLRRKNDLKQPQEKVGKAEIALDAAMNKSRTAKAQMKLASEAAETERMKLEDEQYNLEVYKENITAGESALKSLGGKLNKTQASMEGLEKQESDRQKRLAIRESELEQAQEHLDTVKKEVEDLLKKVRKTKAIMYDAEAAYDYELFMGTPDSILHARLAHNQAKEKYKEAKAEYEDMKDKFTAIETNATVARDKAQRLVDKLGKADDALVKKRAEVDDINKEIRDVEEQLKLLRLRAAESSKAVSEQRKIVKEKESFEAVANKTFGFVREAEVRQRRTLDEKKAKLQEAKDREAEVAKELEKAEEAIETNMEAAKKASADVETMKATFEETRGKLDLQIEKLRNETAALEPSMPEIVKQHGLALLTTLGS